MNWGEELRGSNRFRKRTQRFPWNQKSSKLDLIHRKIKETLEREYFHNERDINKKYKFYQIIIINENFMLYDNRLGRISIFIFLIRDNISIREISENRHGI